MCLFPVSIVAKVYLLPHCKNHFFSIFTTICYTSEWIFFNMSYCVCVWRKKLCNCHSSFFSLLIPFSGRAAKSFLANVLRLVIKKACDQNLTHSLDTPKIISIKIVPEVVTRDACGTWHGLCTVTSIHSIQKSTRNNQKLGNKLAGRWQKIQGSNREKSSWYVKKSEEKEKRRCSKKKIDCRSLWRNIKTVIEEYVLSENVYLHSAGRWSWWSSYVPIINKQTSLNKPTCKLKLFKT